MFAVSGLSNRCWPLRVWSDSFSGSRPVTRWATSSAGFRLYSGRANACRIRLTIPRFY